GNVDPSFAGNVTLVLAANPAGATIGGTLVATAGAGMATFAGLTLNKAAVGDSLQASTGGLSSAVTSGITVGAAPATQLVVTTAPPASITAGSGFGLVVAAADRYGNVDPNYSGNVVLALTNNPAGATLGGGLIAATSGGVATFAGLT